jgi:hypothetical protein
MVLNVVITTYIVVLCSLQRLGFINLCPTRYSPKRSCAFLVMYIAMKTFIEILRIFPNMKQTVFPVLLYSMDLVYNNSSIRIVIMQA